MATLSDSFLADLAELSDNEADIVEEDNGDMEHLQEDVDDDDLALTEKLNYDDDVDTVFKLHKTQHYNEIMQKVESALENDDPEYIYQLIVDCNSLTVDIENEILIVHNYIRDKYRSKFPELESLVQHPIEYALLVKRIGNEMDLTSVDLQGLLFSSATIMVVSVTASTTSGKPLPEEELHKAMDACDRALALDSDKNKLVDFVESKMRNIAPSLSAVVGSAVAAKLVCTAGGLSALAKMPACNLQLLGAKKRPLGVGAPSQYRVGYLDESEILQSTPPSSRKRACRVLAAKSTLAARVDSIRGARDGVTGETYLHLREGIEKKIAEKPHPANQPKALPVPVFTPKKRRGGRRMRRMKERYAMTEMRKMANRVAFNSTEESSLGDGLGEGYGMVGQALGRLSAAGHCPKKLAAKAIKSSQFGNISGLTSSLAFTHMQGIQLSNPQAQADQLGCGAQSTYFSEVGTFSKLKRKRI